MKKMISKASVFLLILIIGLIPVIMADAAYSGKETGSITINNVTSGNTFHGYKIIDIKYDSVHDKIDYEWSSGIADIVKDKKISIEEFFDKSEKDRQYLLSVIPKALNGNPDLEECMADSTGMVKWSDAALGGYLIIPINSADIYQIMLAIVQPAHDTDSGGYHTKSAEIEAKKTQVSITKTADSQSTGISKTVNYTIISDVPAYAEGAADKYYGISDKAVKELVIDRNSIKVYGYTSRENAEKDIDGTEYGSLTPNASFTGLYKECTKLESQTEEQDFAIEFNYDKIPKGIRTIKVRYTGNIKSDAVIETNSLNNKADMEYSSFPFSKKGEHRRHEVKKAEQVVKTYQLQIVKVDAADNTKKLSGAEFNLYRKASEDDKEVILPQQDVPKQLENGDYVYVSHVEPTDKNGITNINNLDLGTYYLVETKAPSGYTLMGKAWEIVVSENAGLNIATGIQTETVVNSKRFNLPQTGDYGTLIFTIAGTVLMLGSVVMFFAVKRRGKA